MFPRESGSEGIRQDLGSFILVTVHPHHVSPAALKHIRTVIVVGKEPGVAIGEFCTLTGRSAPPIPAGDLPTGEALVWFVDSDQPAERVRTEPPRVAADRHKRKYAEGQLDEDRVFYFRGPENKLNLRAQNLNVFVQIAEGVDEATWFYHARRGDFSKWVREKIKDEDLANEIQAVEQDESLSAVDSRGRVGRAIQEKYTAPE
jgi:hypothetical protein